MISHILASMRWRYAVKKFNPKKKLARISLDSLLEVTRLSPSSFGLQPYKILVVENKKLRKQIYEKACDQIKVVEAPYFLVFCTYRKFTPAWVDSFVDLLSKERKLSKEKTDKLRKARREFIKETSPEDLDIWAGHQAFLALGVLLTSAAISKIDACPMGGFKPKELDKVLNLQKYNLRSKVLCTLGYRSPEDRAAKQKKVRWPASMVIMKIK